MRATVKVNLGGVYVTAAEKETTAGRVGLVVNRSRNGVGPVLGIDLDPHQAFILAEEIHRAAEAAFKQTASDSAKAERAALKAA